MLEAKWETGVHATEVPTPLDIQVTKRLKALEGTKQVKMQQNSHDTVGCWGLHQPSTST
jgi:hypothetical protein